MSVIITPECYQESQHIQDLTVKPQMCLLPQETQVLAERCPQCDSICNNTSLRLVHDSCGHLKCRMCLLQEEECCFTCEQDKIKLYNAHQMFMDPPRLPTIEERAPVLMHTPIMSEPPRPKLLGPSDPLESNILRQEALLSQNPMLRSDPLEPEMLRLEPQRPDILRSDLITSDPLELQPQGSIQDMKPFKSEERLEQLRPLSPDPEYILGERGNSPAFSSSPNSPESPRPGITVRKKRQTLEIQKHIKVIPGNPPIYECTICKKSFKTRANIRYHDSCATGTKPYECEICSKGFVAKSHFNYHMRIHSNDRPFRCDDCGKDFNQSCKLYRHLKIHKDERPFMCEQCPKRFRTAYALQNHTMVHSGDKPHGCEQCGRCFSEQSNLKKHVLTHSKEKRFVCEECGKCFTLRCTLNTHRRTHFLRERPFTCEFCDYSFSNKKDLNRHALTHAKNQFLTCPICTMPITRKDNLERHIRNSHPMLTEGELEAASALPLPTTPFPRPPEPEPPRANAVPVINSAPPSAASLLQASYSASLQPLPLVVDPRPEAPQPLGSPQLQPLHCVPPEDLRGCHGELGPPRHHEMPPQQHCHGYTARNLHPETSPHLFVSSKNPVM